MKKALVIGFDNYPNCRLNGCINDAEKFRNIVSRNEDSSKNFDVKLITDENNKIKKSQLKKEIEFLFKDQAETVLLYFSGHGTINSTGGYIVTSYDNDGEFEEFSMDEILKLANDSKATNKVIILDCCFSGAFGSPKVSKGNLTQINEGVTILTASRDNESAMETNGQGVFTSLLLQGLNGAATDLMGNITLASLYSFVDSALGLWDQRPIFKTNTSRFFPIRKVKPPIDISIIRDLTTYFENMDYEFKLNPTYEYTESVAKKENVAIFKKLQKLVSVGLVTPVGEEHMYFAAMNSKSCKLTTLGKRYWILAESDRI